MKIDDTLLQMMIKREMHEKGVSHYLLFDDVMVNPTEIEVRANESCYIVGVSVNTEREFTLAARSGTNAISYNNLNCDLSEGSFSSTRISSHWGTIKLESESVDTDFYVRVIKVSFIC